jgi:hypothetical protein
MKANEAPEQYISKSALVAELKKRFDHGVNGLKAINNGTFWKEGQSEDEFNAALTRCAYNAAKNEIFELICFLDTLEVKEVDLEKEFDKYSFPISAQDIKDEPFTQMAQCAKHFFKLGMQARTDKELVEEVYSHLDSIKEIADRMTSGNFMHHKAAIKFSANTIAKVLELMGLKAQKGE